MPQYMVWSVGLPVGSSWTHCVLVGWAEAVVGVADMVEVETGVTAVSMTQSELDCVGAGAAVVEVK